MTNNYPPADTKLGSKLDKIAYIITAVVIVLVGLMRQYKIDLGADFSFLPPLHAVFNSLVAFFLILAIIFVKRKNIIAHQRSIFGAMLFSALFLVCYVLYHFTTVETKFCQEGTIKTVYFVLLISHIILAGVSLPFILLTYIRGYTWQVTKHRKIAKWVFPIWLYVAISGPICYLMLKPCYI